MIDQLSATQVLALLDKVAKLYPAGIPKAAVKSPGLSSKAQDVKRVLILAMSRDSLQTAEVALAQAICSKGLKIPVEQSEIRAVSKAEISRDEIIEISRSIKCPRILVLGESHIPGAFEQIDGAHILWSYSLADIASDPTRKRDFWEQLKMMISESN
jgi:hypothetical protein